VASLRHQVLVYIQNNLSQWPDFAWDAHLPESLLEALFDPFGGYPPKNNV